MKQPAPSIFRVFDFIKCVEYLENGAPGVGKYLTGYYEWELRSRKYFEYTGHGKPEILDIYDREMFEAFFLLEETFDIKQGETVLFKIDL